MQEFRSIESLLTEIQSDQQSPPLPSAQRYPIRLIFLPNLSMVKSFVNALARLHIEKTELTHFLPHDDGWLTVDGVINVIKELSPAKDYIILPFSEVIRFYPDDHFQVLFHRLAAEFENTGSIRPTRRLYFPLVGIFDRFERVFWRSFHRKTEWAPVWKVTGDQQKITVYLSAHQLLSPNNLHIIHHTREWLNLWKNDDVSTILCYSKILAVWYKYTFPDHAFDLKKVENTRELILNLYDLDLPIPYTSQEQSYWDALWTAIQGKQYADFADLVNHVMNRRKIEKENISNLWAEKPDVFSRWLLKWYVLNRQDWKQSYVFHVLNQVEHFEDHEFIQILWFKIFESEQHEKAWIEERRELLRALSKQLGAKVAHVDDELQRVFSSSSQSLWKRAELFTGITLCERKLTVELSKTADGSQRKFLELLHTIYPHLAYYLADMKLEGLQADTQWVETYFKEYRWAKVKHAKSEKLQQIVAEQNKDKDSFYHWYYAFPTVQAHPLFQEEGIENLIWIDGLGLEWLPLLIRLIEEQGLLIEKKGIARANLPSVTACNRFEQAQHLTRLDQFIHEKSHYSYPDDLVREIEIIAEIVHDHLSSGERLLIVSDHGFTAFALKAFDHEKTYNFAEADHEGRCLWTDAEFLDDQDFIVHTPEDPSQFNKKSVVALKHASLYNVPRREVHGGATPEEVLVPLLLISKGVKPKEQLAYILEPAQHEISYREPVCFFSITPEPELEPKLWYKKDHLVTLQYSNAMKQWSILLNDFQPGQYEFDVEIGDWAGQIAVTITGGMKERDLF